MGIKKIDIPQSTAIDASVLWGGINDNVLAAKINEVIDAINELQEQVVEHDKEIDDCARDISKKETFVSIDEALKMGKKVDPYAEQRKWIGKVCWFWDDDNTNSSCGILTSIDTVTFKEPQFVCNDEYDYEHCEPVKPDDDIIYKGE